MLDRSAPRHLLEHLDGELGAGLLLLAQLDVRPGDPGDDADLDRLVGFGASTATATAAPTDRATARIDQDSGRTIVTVKDKSTGEVVRQIPSEEVLRLAHNLGGKGRNGLLNQTV